MKWFEDQPSQEYKDRVLQNAQGEVERLRKPSPRRVWMWQLASGAALAAVAGVVFKMKTRTETPSEEVASLRTVDPKMLNDLALMQDLDLWQNLDLFEKDV